MAKKRAKPEVRVHMEELPYEVQLKLFCAVMFGTFNVDEGVQDARNNPGGKYDQLYVKEAAS